MASSTPTSRSGSPRGGGGGGPGSGGGGPGSGSGSGGSVSLTLLSPAAPSTSTAAAGAVFSALPSCLMPEAFTGEGDFEDYLQQFTTAATLSGWQTATTENRRTELFCIKTQRKCSAFLHNTHSSTTTEF